MFPVVLIVFSFGGFLAAQITGQVLRGEVVGGDPKTYMEGRLQVEVYDSASHMVLDRVPVAPNGSFEFRTQSQSNGGGLDIRLVNQRGDVLRQERYISTMATPGPLRLSLASSRPSERPSGEVVSVGRLSHKPTKKAFKLFRQAEKANDQRRFEEAVRLLEEAVKADPEFMEAYNSLGNRLLQLKRLPAAVQAFQKAIEIDPADSKPYSNLAITQMHLGQYVEAERTARRAAQMQRNTRHADYIVGLSLVAQKKNLPEALSLLERSAGELPHAHMAAGQILVHMGRLDEAAVHLETYLKSTADGPSHRVVEQWMQFIRSRKAVAN